MLLKAQNEGQKTLQECSYQFIYMHSFDRILTAAAFDRNVRQKKTKREENGRKIQSFLLFIRSLRLGLQLTSARIVGYFVLFE